MKYIVALSCFLSVNTFAQNHDQKIKNLVPKNWKIIASARGDLNKDQLEDLVLVIENTDPSNIEVINKGEEFERSLNHNPRSLVVYFQNKNKGFDKILTNNHIIPPQNDRENDCLLDPFDDTIYATDSFHISKGTLRFGLSFFYSCGSWEVNSVDYVFRYQNNRFELMGVDIRSTHRGSGETHNVSINYSTQKVKSTKGNISSDKEKTTWKTFKLDKPINLAEIKEPLVWKLYENL